MLIASIPRSAHTGASRGWSGDAELVALGIGHHSETAVGICSNLGGAKCEQAVDLLVDRASRHEHVQVRSVLGDLRLRNGVEQHGRPTPVGVNDLPPSLPEADSAIENSSQEAKSPGGSATS